MNARILLTLGLLSSVPSGLLAQSYPEPVPAVPPAPAAVRAPRAPRSPAAPAVPPAPDRAVVAARPAIPATPAMPEVPPSPASPSSWQAPPAPKPAPAAPAAAPAAPAPPAPARMLGQMINVRIDVTLTDSKGAPKTLTMTVADGENGMNRTTSARPDGGDYSFNADAGPTVVGNKIRLRLTADAVVPVENEKANGGRLGLRQSQTLILSDGQSVEIARAADPVSDRAFVLTVKATIQR